MMMGLAVIVGATITLHGQPPLLPSLLGFMTAFCLTSSSMAMNDYYDREVDALNEPGRPVPQGIVKPKEALSYMAILAGVGLTTAALLNLLSLLVAGLSLTLSSYYSMEGKKLGLFGNFMVSGCVAVPFLYGAFIVGSAPGSLLTVFALLAFVSNTGREVIKGIVDVEGDKLRCVRTLALRSGCRHAARVAAALYGAAVAVSALPLLGGMVSALYLPFVLAADAGFLYSAISIARRPSRENAKRTKKMSLLWMLLGLVAFLAGGTTSPIKI
ncbi:MAG: UbiA family prenyltransferase [Candidatus Bathyarchaeia archaeon]